MYRRPKFLEILLEIRREMAIEADYDVDLFAEIARSGTLTHQPTHNASQDQSPIVGADRPINNGKSPGTVETRD